MQWFPGACSWGVLQHGLWRSSPRVCLVACPQLDVVPAWAYRDNRANLDVMVAVVSNSTGTPVLLSSANSSDRYTTPAILMSIEATLTYMASTPGT